MNEQTALTTRTGADAAIDLVRGSLTSEHSKRAYTRALTGFLAWMKQTGKPFIKATVQEYRQSLVGSPASINLAMSAIRKLANEAADSLLLDQAIANGVSRVKGVTSHGVRSGNWLTRAQAQQILTAPNVETLKGLRDRAVLAVMIGAGLRRAEVAALSFEHIQQRDSRWLIVDITGKGNRVRSIPIPSWVKLAIDEWAGAAGISSGLVFRAFFKNQTLRTEPITPQAIRDIVKLYGSQIGVPELAAHDLRRTFAKLARKGGSDVLQIQLSLGHAASSTTEKYLGETQDLTDAPCDHLGLSLDN